MPQSLSKIAIHLVFSTKNRQPVLTDEVLRSELHKYLGGVSRSLDCPTIVVGGVEDHVHILGRMSRTISPADWVKELKRVTSHWLKKQQPELDSFRWQAGYGAFSVSQSEIERVVKYIKNQHEHHRQQDFKAEFRL